MQLRTVCVFTYVCVCVCMCADVYKKNSKPFTFCLPGNLNLARLKASMQDASCCGLERMDMMGWPMFTRATVPCGLPKAPLIPVWSLQRKTAGQQGAVYMRSQCKEVQTTCRTRHEKPLKETRTTLTFCDH